MTDPVSPEPSRAPLSQRLLAWVQHRRLLSDARLLQLYPPFWWMRIKVLELAPEWSRVRVRLPLTAISRNPGGIMFGGFQAALADPIPALACLRRYPGHSVWTRSMSIDFEHGGHTDLELRFEFTAEQDAAIRKQLADNGRATPTFEYGFYLADGTRCTVVRNTVAIRPGGYRSSTGPANAQSG
jgi:acyl-coenzyme A thioesterase PaaI-like protein